MFCQYSVILCVFVTVVKLTTSVKKWSVLMILVSNCDWLIADLTCNVNIFIYVYCIGHKLHNFTALTRSSRSSTPVGR